MPRKSEKVKTEILFYLNQVKENKLSEHLEKDKEFFIEFIDKLIPINSKKKSKSLNQ